MDKNMAFVCDQDYAIVTLIFEEEKTLIWEKQMLKTKTDVESNWMLKANGCWKQTDVESKWMLKPNKS